VGLLGNAGQVAYYASGEHEVPRTVLLACKGWEVERQAAA